MGKSKSSAKNWSAEASEILKDHPDLARLQSKLHQALGSASLDRTARVGNFLKVLESQTGQFDVESNDLAYLMKLLRGVK